MVKNVSVLHQGEPKAGIVGERQNKKAKGDGRHPIASRLVRKVNPSSPPCYGSRVLPSVQASFLSE